MKAVNVDGAPRRANQAAIGQVIAGTGKNSRKRQDTWDLKKHARAEWDEHWTKVLDLLRRDCRLVDDLANPGRARDLARCDGIVDLLVCIRDAPKQAHYKLALKNLVTSLVISGGFPDYVRGNNAFRFHWSHVEGLLSRDFVERPGRPLNNHSVEHDAWILFPTRMTGFDIGRMEAQTMPEAIARLKQWDQDSLLEGQILVDRYGCPRGEDAAKEREWYRGRVRKACKFAKAKLSPR